MFISIRKELIQRLKIENSFAFKYMFKDTIKIIKIIFL